MDSGFGAFAWNLVASIGAALVALARRWWHWHKMGKPCLVTVHGMLEPWALAHKALKKQVAWHGYQKHILNRVGMLHATSEREASNLRALGLRPPIATIPWGGGAAKC
jgi:Glycosyltransferase Family 4